MPESNMPIGRLLTLAVISVWGWSVTRCFSFANERRESIASTRGAASPAGLDLDGRAIKPGVMCADTVNESARRASACRHERGTKADRDG
jgi:hypothetical protein